MKTYTVDRSLWLRGNGDGLLLSPATGLMCCLGHCLLQDGVGKLTMRSKGVPQDIPSVLPPESPFLRGLQRYEDRLHSRLAKRQEEIGE